MWVFFAQKKPFKTVTLHKRYCGRENNLNYLFQVRQVGDRRWQQVFIFNLTSVNIIIFIFITITITINIIIFIIITITIIIIGFFRFFKKPFGFSFLSKRRT